MGSTFPIKESGPGGGERLWREREKGRREEEGRRRAGGKGRREGRGCVYNFESRREEGSRGLIWGCDSFCLLLFFVYKVVYVLRDISSSDGFKAGWINCFGQKKNGS